MSLSDVCIVPFSPSSSPPPPPPPPLPPPPPPLSVSLSFSLPPLLPLPQDNLFEWHFTIRGPEGTEFEGGYYHGRVILPSEYPMKPPSIILMTVSEYILCREHCQRVLASNLKYPVTNNCGIQEKLACFKCTLCVKHTHMYTYIKTFCAVHMLFCVCVQPNGRFALHQKICLSASSYHPELWQPSWSSERSPPSLTSQSPPPPTHTHSHTNTHTVRTVLLAIIGFMPTEGVGAVGALDCSPTERKKMAKR